jgi:outer membrane biosynthesis protein TonB
VQAQAIEPLVQPVYPPAALGRDPGTMTVGLELEIDRNGYVAGVAPSLVGFSTPGPFAAEFRAAAEEAVRQWRFEPARRGMMQPVAGGRWRMADSEDVPTKLDVAVTFTAEGRVLK